MKKIVIISGSVRTGRLSHRVALFLADYLRSREIAEAEILDLKEYDFPLFHERLMNMPEPDSRVVDFARRFEEAAGVIIVSPVYNGSFSAAVKNVIDLMVGEWTHKPVMAVSVTYSTTPGITTVQELQAMLLKMNARVSGPLYTVIRAGELFDPAGRPLDPDTVEKFAAPPIKEFMWMVEKSEFSED